MALWKGFTECCRNLWLWWVCCPSSTAGSRQCEVTVRWSPDTPVGCWPPSLPAAGILGKVLLRDGYLKQSQRMDVALLRYGKKKKKEITHAQLILFFSSTWEFPLLFATYKWFGLQYQMEGIETHCWLQSQWYQEVVQPAREKIWIFSLLGQKNKREIARR